MGRCKYFGSFLTLAPSNKGFKMLRLSNLICSCFLTVLQRWGIDWKKLPQASVIFGDPEAVFWARAESFFLVSTMAVVFAVLTLWLVFSLKQRKKMTEALTESKDTLDAILKSIGDPMSMVDQELNILWGNDPAKSIFGEDIIGKKCYEAFHWRREPCEPYPCHVLKAFDDRQIHKAESLSIDLNSKEMCFLSAAKVALSDQTESPIAVLQICRDITAIKRVQEELLLAKCANDSSTNPIAIADLHGRLTYVNKSLLDLWGYSTSQDVLGKQIFSFLKSPGEGLHAIRMLKKHGEWSGELQGLKKDGSLLMVEILANVVSNPAGEPISLTASFTDVTEAKRAEEKIKQLAYFDFLTGLPNRTLLKNRMELAINHLERAGEMAAILLFDLDNFKIVNDTFGHAKGDLILQEVVSRISPVVRKADTFARWGGDEFVLLLIDIKDEEDAAIVAEKTLNRLSQQPFDLGGNQVHLSASIGIALCPRDGMDPDLLLDRADLALYESKKAGRNRYHFFSEQMNAKIVEWYEMEKSLWRALQQEEFSLVYQPQVDLRTSQIIGVEALLRWRSPEKGLLAPAQFLFVAEEAGLVHALGEWTLRTACMQTVAWQQMGHGPLPLAVNLSSLQFRHPDFVARVEQVLQETGLSPHLLELEITENALTDSTENVIKALAALKTLGIRIAIDDFGTGHFSLNYLKLFPIDRLKIAQDFVQNILVEPKDAAIVESIIAIARKFQLRVIAEGVETQEQLEFFQRRDCFEIQGHYFSKPMDHEAVSAYLENREPLQNSALADCRKEVAPPS